MFWSSFGHTARRDRLSDLVLTQKHPSRAGWSSVHKATRDRPIYLVTPSRDGNGGKSKSRKVAPGGGQGAKLPEAESFFSKLKVSKNKQTNKKKPKQKKPNPVSDTILFQKGHSQNTVYCALRLSSRGTNQASTNFQSKDSILRTQTTKVAYIITFLSGHMCLSTWTGAVVFN